MCILSLKTMELETRFIAKKFDLKKRKWERTNQVVRLVLEGSSLRIHIRNQPKKNEFYLILKEAKITMFNRFHFAYLTGLSLK